MKQRNITFLLTMLMCMVGATSFAHDFAVANADGGTIYYVKTSDTEVAVSYRGSSYSSYSNEYTGNRVIPATVSYSGKTYNVTSIGYQAFDGCSLLTSVTIPNSVTSIGSYAFNGCSRLTSVTIPNSVTSIGSYAFNGCSGLTSVTIPNSVTSIGEYAFSGCSRLTSINIPNSVTSIGNGAFYDCSKLIKVSVDIETPLAISSNTFSNRANAILYVPEGCRAAYMAAEFWKEFKKIYENKIDPSPKIVFADVMVKRLCYDNWDINRDGELSEAEAAAVSDLGTVFKNNTTITSFNELRYFTGLTSIGNSAFQGCSDLTSITIPNSVTSIGQYAFSGCSGLSSVIVDSENTKYDSRNDCNAIIETTSNTLIFGCKTTVIPNSVRSIGQSAFSGCIGLTAITIPNSVTSIGEYAFSGCIGLTSIEIPNSVSIIGEGAFKSCSGLKSVTIPNSLTTIGHSAFRYCSGLTSITIPNSVTSIGYYAFDSCSGLTSVTIPNSVTSIGNSAFYDCSGLTSVSVDIETPLAISSNTFSNRANAILYVPEGCRAAYQAANYWKEFKKIYENKIDPSAKIVFTDANVKSVCVSNWDINGDEELSEAEAAAVTDLGTVFKNNTTITSFNELQYFTGLTSIGQSAFYECSGLTSINIPNSVTSIKSKVFYGCSGLTSVTIPDGVTSIGYQAFDGCSGLTAITIPNSVTSIGSSAFSNTWLKSLIIGTGVRSIGDNVLASGAKPVKVYWLPNTPPAGYTGAEGTVNYVANKSYTDLSNTTVYNLLSSMFEVDAVKYVPISFSERTCDAIDCIYNKSIEHLSIGKSVSYKGVTMTVKSLKWFACYQNTFLKEVDLAFDGPLGDYAFQGCPQLATVTMEEGITSIGNHTFDACNVIPEMIIPNTVLTIGNYAFAGCSILPNIVIPQSVTSIGDFAFSGCTSITSLSMADRKDDDVELTLGSNGYSPLFADCPLEEVYIGRNISYPTEESRGYSPFYRNLSLKAVTITDKETEISENEFYGCSNLKNVTIGDGVTTICDYAFSGCSSIDNFSFGTKVKTIGKEAFSDCTAMTSLVSRASVPPVCDSQALDDIRKFDCTLSIPTGTLAAYQAADQWKEFLFFNEIDVVVVTPGDANGDGKVNITDAVAVVDYILGNAPEGFNAEAADVNKDGNVNITDAVGIVDIILNAKK